MTPAQLNTVINRKCRTNDTTFPQADKLVLANVFKDEISSKIVERNSGYFLIPVTFDLVADQRQYALPDDQLNRIQKVEIKFAADDDRLEATYVKDYLESEAEDEIVNNFTNQRGEFAYIIRRRALTILSGTIIAVTAGVRVWYHAYPADIPNLTSAEPMEYDPTTTSFGFPRQFHELLARRVAMEYKGSQPKPIPLAPKELAYETDLQVQLDAIAHIDNSGEIIGQIGDASNFGDNGYDY